MSQCVRLPTLHSGADTGAKQRIALLQIISQIDAHAQDDISDTLVVFNLNHDSHPCPEANTAVS